MILLFLKIIREALRALLILAEHGFSDSRVRLDDKAGGLRCRRRGAMRYPPGGQDSAVRANADLQSPFPGYGQGGMFIA